MNPATFVPPSGDPGSRIAFVGEQPGRMEIRSMPRKPFVGPAGQELMSCLANVGLLRSDAYFTNVIKDLDEPLDRYISFSKQGVHISPKGHEYIAILKDELSKTSANVIVAVGGVALYALTQRTGITKWRGSILESTILPGRKVIPIIHPATILPPKNVYTNKYLITTDLARVVAESAYPDIVEPDLRLHLAPSYEDIIQFLTDAIAYGERGFPLFMDIEVIGEIDCISVAYDPQNAISIPFVGGNGDYLTLQQEIAIWRILAAIIEDPVIPKGGQNFIFDLSFIFRKYGIVPRGDLYCTMVAQKILYPDFSVGLDFITSLYTNLPYYKEDGKKWMKGVESAGRKRWWQYNALDSIACAIAMPRQLTDLEEQGNLEVFKRKMKVMPPLMYMSEHGIKVNTSGLANKSVEVEAEIRTVEQQLFDEVGYELNYNSPKQLAHYFYELKKIPPYRKRTPKGYVITTDETAMIRLATTKGLTEARTILKLRKLRKLASTYLDLSKISSDSRLRCQYRPHGTDTGRYSSSEDIFGEGMNQQNIPHDILTYLEADEGYIYYAFDKSQIENRIVAYVGRVTAMIQAFEQGIDLHKMTGGLVFGKSWETVSSVPGSTQLGGGAYSERDFGKKANHSLNYDFGAPSFALKYEITVKDAKWIVDRYHQVYPEIRQVYHQMIKDSLRKDRTLTNLMGRKRTFLGAFEDSMFKAAYAHIPQSTVADLIDEYAINYIWYNPDLFHDLQLLIQIHDSVGFQLPIAMPWPEQAEKLLLIHSSMNAPLRWHDREFVVPTDLTMGLTLNKESGREIKDKNLPRDKYKLGEMLEKNYMELKK